MTIAQYTAENEVAVEKRKYEEDLASVQQIMRGVFVLPAMCFIYNFQCVCMQLQYFIKLFEDLHNCTLIGSYFEICIIMIFFY